MTRPDSISASFDAGRDVLVADIGGSNMRLGRHSHGTACEVLATVPTPAQDWSRFCAALGAALHPHASASTVLSMSIAGVVSPETGEVTAANLPCLNGRRLAQDLQAQFGMRVIVHNDADCAALAEAHVGAGKGHGVMFCAVLGTGVGGGLVVDGRLVQGAGGLTGEWGHGPVVNEATVRAGDGRSVRLPRFPCGCGLSGCVNTVGSARGIERLHAFLHQRELTSREILATWMAGEPLATATVEAYVELVSGPFALVVNITGASVVPVFGGLGRCEALVTALDIAVRQQVLRRSDRALLIPSMLHDQAGLIGAAYAFEGVGL